MQNRLFKTPQLERFIFFILESIDGGFY
jgi:hypothetical protein